MIRQALVSALLLVGAGCDSGGDDGVQVPAENDPYPTATIEDCDGGAVSVADLIAQDDVVFFTFAAKWCTACEKEAPRINAELVEGLAAESVGIYQILIENNPGEAPPRALCAAWRDGLDAEFTVLVDPDQRYLESAFGGAVGGTLPVHYVVTKDGIIRLRKVGDLPSDIAQIMRDWLPTP